jgi:agmatinase
LTNLLDMTMRDHVSFLPYAGAVTFFRCEQTRDLTDVDIAIVGVPFDNGVSNRPGARMGPRAIREASLLTGTFHHPWPVDIRSLCRIIDYGDVGYGYGIGGMSFMMKDSYEHALRILSSGAKLLTIGGDHSIPYGPLRAASEIYGPLALIHFDSHQDSIPNQLCHGTFASDSVNSGWVNAAASVQVYIRTNSPSCGMQIIYAEEANELGPEKLAATIRTIVGDRPVYLTFDIDALDPAYAPGTGTPVIGGPSSREVRAMLLRLHGLNIVAADVVEVAPVYDPTERTQLAAATIANDLLYLLAGYQEGTRS